MSYKKYLDILGNVCIVCYHSGEDNIVHHIKTQGARPDLKNDIKNMCVLCFKHHSMLEHKTDKEIVIKAINKYIKTRKL